MLYVMFIENCTPFNDIDEATIKRHQEHLKKYYDEKKLILSGPFKDYEGVAGMVVLKTGSYEEAEEICKQEPFVAEGYATYRLVTLQISYLAGGN